MKRLVAGALALASAALLGAQTKPVAGCADLRSLTNNAARGDRVRLLTPRPIPFPSSR
jgi:hypothetical protein